MADIFSSIQVGRCTTQQNPSVIIPALSWRAARGNTAGTCPVLPTPDRGAAPSGPYQHRDLATPAAGGHLCHPTRDKTRAAASIKTPQTAPHRKPRLLASGTAAVTPARRPTQAEGQAPRRLTSSDHPPALTAQSRLEYPCATSRSSRRQHLASLETMVAASPPLRLMHLAVTVLLGNTTTTPYGSYTVLRRPC